MVFPLKSVLITDEIDQKCVDILKSNGIEVTKSTKLSKEELLVEIAVSLHVCGITPVSGGSKIINILYMLQYCYASNQDCLI